MSLLRRIQSDKQTQLLRHLLNNMQESGKLQPHLDAVLEAWQDDVFVQKQVNPINFLLSKSPLTGKAFQQTLLERLHAQDDLLPRIHAILADDEQLPDISLTDAEQRQFENAPVEFLLKLRPAGYYARPALTDLKESDSFITKKQVLINNIVANVDQEQSMIASYGDHAAMHGIIETLFNRSLTEAGLSLSKPERVQLFDAVVAEILGLGPLEALLADETITEIRVLGPHQIAVVRDGRSETTDITFDDTDHVWRIIDRIVAPIGKRCNESTPYVAARLPDGSNVTVLAPPISLTGPSIIIQKATQTITITADEMLQSGTLTQDALTVLQAGIVAGLNCLITGSDSRTPGILLNTLATLIPESAFIATVEQSPQLMLPHSDVLSLIPLMPTINNNRHITKQDILIQLASTPLDYIIVDELNGGEFAELLQSTIPWLSTLRTGYVEDTLTLLLWYFAQGKRGLAVEAIREQIARRVDLIVHVERTRTDSIRITGIYTLSQSETASSLPLLNALFQFDGVSNTLIKADTLPAKLAQRLTSPPVGEDLAQRIQAIIALDA